MEIKGIKTHPKTQNEASIHKPKDNDTNGDKKDKGDSKIKEHTGNKPMIISLTVNTSMDMYRIKARLKP